MTAREHESSATLLTVICKMDISPISLIFIHSSFARCMADSVSFLSTEQEKDFSIPHDYIEAVGRIYILLMMIR